MKLGIFLVLLGAVFTFDGTLRLAMVGWPGLSGFIFAGLCFYFGIRRIVRITQKRSLELADNDKSKSLEQN